MINIIFEHLQHITTVFLKDDYSSGQNSVYHDDITLRTQITNDKTLHRGAQGVINYAVHTAYLPKTHHRVYCIQNDAFNIMYLLSWNI